MRRNKFSLLRSHRAVDIARCKTDIVRMDGPVSETVPVLRIKVQVQKYK